MCILSLQKVETQNSPALFNHREVSLLPLGATLPQSALRKTLSSTLLLSLKHIQTEFNIPGVVLHLVFKRWVSMSSGSIFNCAESNFLYGQKLHGLQLFLHRIFYSPSSPRSYASLYSSNNVPWILFECWIQSKQVWLHSQNWINEDPRRLTSDMNWINT